MRREKALKSFKKASYIRVLLICLESSAFGSTLIAATHIILINVPSFLFLFLVISSLSPLPLSFLIINNKQIDPVKGSKKEALATEHQTIERSHRQGQDKQVTIVRYQKKQDKRRKRSSGDERRYAENQNVDIFYH